MFKNWLTTILGVVAAGAIVYAGHGSPQSIAAALPIFGLGAAAADARQVPPNGK